MAELTMLADIQRTVYPEVTSRMHVMEQARESMPARDWRSNHCAKPPTSTLLDKKLSKKGALMKFDKLASKGRYGVVCR